MTQHTPLLTSVRTNQLACKKYQLFWTLNIFWVHVLIANLWQKRLQLIHTVFGYGHVVYKLNIVHYSDMYEPAINGIALLLN